MMIRLLRGFLVVAAVTVVLAVEVEAGMGVEVTPTASDGARQALGKELPAAVAAASATLATFGAFAVLATSASRLPASAASRKRAQTGPSRATPSRLR